jgi:hypothetical protein
MKATRSRLWLAALLTVAVLFLLWLGSQRWEGKRLGLATTGPAGAARNSTPVPATESTISPKTSPQATMEAQEKAFITAFNTPIAWAA